MKIGYKDTGEAVQGVPEAKQNLSGGVAFDIKDPSVKLLTMVGASFFDEPTYYEPDEEQAKKRDEKRPALAAYVKSGAVSAEALAALTDRSREMIETAMQVADSDRPKDLLSLAYWARKEMNIRTTPQVLLAIAAAAKQTRGWVRQYVSNIVQRADEIRDVFAIYTHFFGRPLPACLKRGLADALTKFGEYELMKYDTDAHPTFRDVLMMVDRSKDWPLSKELYEFIVNGKVIDGTKTPVVAARKKLSELKVWGPEAQELAKAGSVTWEVLHSQFGSNADAKNWLWSFLVNEDLLGYMALLRNLRNILEAKVSTAVIERVASKIEDPEQVKRSKQLPFRFYSAAKAVSEIVQSCDPIAVNRILSALDLALKRSCENLPHLPGTTAIFADNSGSMNDGVSGKSQVRRCDAANMLAAISLFVSDAAVIGAFGTEAALVPASRQDAILSVMERVKRADTQGCGTNGHRVFQLLTRRSIKVDRVILVSDMQCWNDGNFEGSVAGALSEYRRIVNPKAVLHSIDVCGHGDSVVPSNDKATNLLAGFSEKILARCAEFEGYGMKIDRPLPAIDYVRSNF